MGLTNSQYDAIMRDYQRVQNENRQLQAKRQREVYEKIPSLADLDAQIAREGVALAKRLLETDTAYEGFDFSRQVRQIRSSRALLLKAGGYPSDYLELQYRCDDCKDTGYCGDQKCHCFKQAIIDRLYTESNLQELLSKESFSDFSLEYYSEAQRDPLSGQSARQLAERALKECWEFVRNFDAGAENLFLYGDTGLGKTFLSHCIAKELLSTAHSVIYFTSFRLFEQFADAAFGRAESVEAEELSRQIYECDLLMIDDLGTELTNSFVASRLFLVLNERMLRGKSTLISTNLSLAKVAELYSERVFSRITSNYRMLKLIGEDIRLQKKFAQNG